MKNLLFPFSNALFCRLYILHQNKKQNLWQRINAVNAAKFSEDNQGRHIHNLPGGVPKHHLAIIFG